MEGVE
jgi:DNA repair exonuclease SbcCD ATPase subunit